MLIRAIHQVGDVAVGLMDRGHVVEELCLRVTLERKVLGALDALVLELAKGMVEVGEPFDQPFAHQSLQVLLHALHLHHDRARGHVVCHRERRVRLKRKNYRMHARSSAFRGSRMKANLLRFVWHVDIWLWYSVLKPSGFPRSHAQLELHVRATDVR